MEKIIITGGTGFIGKHLVNKLLSYGKCSIALVSNTRNFDPRQFSQASSQEKAQLRFYSADIRNEGAFQTYSRTRKQILAYILQRK